MTERYLGSIISPNPVEPSEGFADSTASGVWNIHDPLIFGQAGDWPDPTNIKQTGLFAGGSTGTHSNVVDEINTASAGDATDFGDLTVVHYRHSAGGSDTRFILAGGGNSGGFEQNVISYMTYATAGNSVDFGDLTSASNTMFGSSMCNNVRYLHTFGFTSGTSGTINYITIASTGNATDFGDQTATFYYSNIGNISSTTRGIMGGSGNSTYNQTIHYVTIASAGNTTDFGDLTNSSPGYGGRFGLAGMSSATRGLFAGGYYAAYENIIDYITIASTGNAQDFGDLSLARGYTSGLSSSTRGVIGGGVTSGDVYRNEMDFVTIASTGNAQDFGDLTLGRGQLAAGCSAQSSVQNESYFAPASIGLYAGGTEPVNSVNQSLVSYINIATDGEAAMFGDLSTIRYNMFSGGMASSTRAVFGGGTTPSVNYSDTIDFLTFSTKGKATDFGNTTVGRTGGASLSNSTRGLMAGGSASSASNVVDYITIASAGDATDFGDASAAYGQQGATAGTTRGLVAGGAGPVNTIDYYTIASTGNATDFGDLTVARRLVPAGLSSNTRAVFGGGNSGSASDVMDYVTIASTGNATDFGNLTAASLYSAGLSNKTQGLYTAWGSSGALNVDKITIASTGNATDWGENIHKNYGIGSASNSHGGI